VAQFHQPTAQARAGRVTDSHVIDDFRRAEAALMEIGNRRAVTVWLQAIEVCGILQYRREATPLAEQR
jgi:hypothetical protein